MLKRLWNSGLRPLLIIIGVFLVLLLAAYGWARHTVGRELDAAMQAARDADVALTRDELHAQWIVGMDYYDGPFRDGPAAQICRYEFPPEFEQTTSIDTPYPIAELHDTDAAFRPPMKRSLQRLHEDVQWLKELASKARPPPQFAPAPTPDFESLILLPRAATLHAHFDVREGRMARGFQTTAAVLQFAAHIRSFPELIIPISGWAELAAAEFVAYLPNSVELHEPSAKELIELLSEAAPQNEFVRTSEWEIVRMLPRLRHATLEPFSASIQNLPGWILAQTGLPGLIRARYLANYTHAMVMYIDYARRPYYKGYPALQQLQQDTSPESIPFATLAGRRPTIGPRSYQDNAVTQALCRAAALDLAVRLFRQDQGELPPNLTILTPDYLEAVPTDPFSGDPMQYQLNGGIYRIHSEGETIIDPRRNESIFPDVTYTNAAIETQHEAK